MKAQHSCSSKDERHGPVFLKETMIKDHIHTETILKICGHFSLSFPSPFPIH